MRLEATFSHERVEQPLAPANDDINVVRPVEHWRALRSSLRRNEFADLCPYLFLVWANVPSPAPSPVSDHRGVFETPRQMKAAKPVALGHGEAILVAPIRKDVRQGLPDRISVGRAPNCDVVIPISCVSRLHGYFRNLSTTQAEFIDANSSNGTRVNGLAVMPDRPTSVSSLDYLDLGGALIQLFASADFYDCWL